MTTEVVLGEQLDVEKMKRSLELLSSLFILFVYFFLFFLFSDYIYLLGIGTLFVFSDYIMKAIVILISLGVLTFFL